MRAITSTKGILDFAVSLRVIELLASTPVVEKQLTNAIFKDKAFQLYSNTLSLAEVLETLTPYSQYFIGSIEAKICLENRSKVTALVDNSTQINVMTRDLIEDTNLAIR